MAKKKRTPEETKAIIMGRVRQRDRPLFIGQVALDLDCSLSEAECAVLALVHEGLLRQTTAVENYTLGIRSGYLPVVPAKNPQS